MYEHTPKSLNQFFPDLSASAQYYGPVPACIGENKTRNGPV